LNTHHNPSAADDFDDDSGISQKPSLDAVIDLLRTFQGEVLPAAVCYGLSDLSDEDVAILKPVWMGLDGDVRRKVLSELAEISEVDFTLNYAQVGYMGLDDPQETVRESAIELLWFDESDALLEWLMNAAQMDEAASVRAAACSALGRFILMGEYEEIPANRAAQAQDVVVTIWTDETEDVQVRRRALEALSNSSHDLVPEAIQTAYESGDYWLRVSSIYAMGHSADRRWREIVLAEMGSGEAEIRYEATRAAGELDLSEAVKPLGYLALDSDRDISLAAIWSLGEIGGAEALRILSALAQDIEQADDDDMREAVEDAIGNATMVGDFLLEDDEDED